ncbi:MAG: hypothetical protein ACREBQ_07585 [Nitrososphaerales archaeon]
MTTENKADVKILDAVQDAREQAGSWIDAYLFDLDRKAMDGNQEAGTLALKIYEEKKQERKWEISAWTLKNSSLEAGESINLELGNGVVAVEGTVQTEISRGLPIPPSTSKPEEKIIYMVTAPPEIRSRILMEGLRHDLSNYSALLQFDGEHSDGNPLFVAWKSAWFDAQGVYCKYNPGEKFTDLNGDEQICKSEPPANGKRK